VNITSVDIKDGDVIVINDPDDSISDFDAFAGAFHDRYPSSLVVVFGPGGSLETRDEEELRTLLQALIEHREGRDA